MGNASRIPAAWSLSVVPKTGATVSIRAHRHGGIPIDVPPQVHQLIAHVHREYGCHLEYLWQRSPNNGIWRRGDNQKWFACLLLVPCSKIIPGPDDALINVLNLRCAPDVLDFIIDGRNIFPGWHMNKRHWISIILDGRMKNDDIYKLLKASHDIAAKK